MDKTLIHYLCIIMKSKPWIEPGIATAKKASPNQRILEIQRLVTIICFLTFKNAWRYEICEQQEIHRCYE